jgi:hypothetical protein
LQSCGPTLLFTHSQFDDVKSDISIPSDWQGSWVSDRDTFYVSNDSISIIFFQYKIDSTKLNFENDSSRGRDKIIFMDDWCFMQVYINPDSLENFGGFWVFVANKNSEGNISCWEMEFEHFIKDIELLPIMKYEYVNLKSDGRVKIMEPVCRYIQMPNYSASNKNKAGNRLYTKILKKSIFALDKNPAICNGFYDIEFFKKIALENSPKLVLNKDKTVSFPDKKPTKFIKKLGKTHEKNFNKEYKRIIFSN